MNRRHQRHLRILAALSGLAMGGLVHAQTQSWIDILGGSASDPFNWSPAGVPTASSNLLWTLSGGYTVTFDAGVPTSRTNTFRSGSLLMDFSTPHTATHGITIGNTAGSSAIITQNGSWTSGANGNVIIGDVPGATGSLRVRSGGSTFRTTGTNRMLVGHAGTGTLIVESAAQAQIDGLFRVGVVDTATGTLTITGAASVSPFTPSRLIVNSTDESIWGEGGDATVTISAGAHAQFAESLVIASERTSFSAVSVIGRSLGGASVLTVARDLSIGRNTDDGAAAGAAALNCDATITVGETTFLAGDPDGGSGTLTTGPSGVLTTRSLVLGKGATLNHAEGVITIDGGELANLTDAEIGIPGTPGRADLEFRNRSSSFWPAFGGVSMRSAYGSGANRTETSLRSGSVVNAEGNVIFAGGADDVASLFISETGSTLAIGPGASCVIGEGGTANAQVTNGGRLEAGGLVVGKLAGGSGHITFLGTNTSGSFGSVAIGGSLDAAGGIGTVDVLPSTRLAVMPAGGRMVVWPNGTLVVHAAHVDATGCEVDVRGVINMLLASRIAAGSFTIRGGGRLTSDEAGAGAPTVLAPTRVLSGGQIVVTNGQLALGSAVLTNGFVSEAGSTIVVNANDELILNDADSAVVHAVTLDQATLRADNGLMISPGGRISGRGSIIAPRIEIPSGESPLHATTTLGLLYSGRVLGTDVILAGTKHRFTGPLGGFQGSGVIEGEVTFFADTTLRAEGDTVLGNGSTAGVTFGSAADLHADGSTVTMLDNDGVSLGGITDMKQAGRIVCAAPLIVPLAGRLSGRGGVYETPLVTVAGRLAPSDLAGEPLGETGNLTISGSLALTSTAVFTAQIGGIATSDDYDRVTVTGHAALGGTLRVQMIRGYSLPPGESLLILDAGSISGAFSAIDLPPAYVADISPTTVRVRHCASDFNSDGFIDFFDYDEFVACYEGEACPPGASADTNRDGFTDFFDYDDFVIAFEAGC